MCVCVCVCVCVCRVCGGGKRSYSDLSSAPEIMPGIRGPTGGWPSQQAPLCSCAAGSKHLTHQRWGQPGTVRALLEVSVTI